MKHLHTLNELYETFPLSAYKSETLYPAAIGTPSDFALMEQIRKQIFFTSDQTNPSAICLFGIRKDYDVTESKVGGQPALPSHIPWPMSRDSKPMTFLVQVNFRRINCTRHLSLPGDILLVFMRDRDIHIGDDVFHYVWVSIDKRQSVAELPTNDTPFEFIHCTAFPMECVDYLLSASEVRARLSRVPQVNASVSDNAILKLCRLGGLKVGGLPPWNEWEDPVILTFESEQFLFSLPPISVRYNVPFPFLDHPEPFIYDRAASASKSNFLSFLDGCTIYFFLTHDGSVSAYHQQPSD